MTPLNALTLEPLTGFSAVVSPLAYICEPFVGFPGYLSTLHRPGYQILSWIAWISLAIILWHAATRQRLSLRPLLGQLALSWMTIGFVCLYILFVPLPAVRIIPPDKDTIFFDIHSHTFFSHDGLASPQENISWHLRHNFSAWFITDHWGQNDAGITIAIAEKTPPFPTVIEGEEVSDDSGNYLLILGGRASFFSSRWLSLKELVKQAHSIGGIVVSAHWWERNTPLKDLVSAGVDGVEIANGGHPSIPEGKRKEALEMSKKAPLTLLAASDWHGWGSFCTTWNAIRIPGWKGMNTEEKRKEIISATKEGKSRIIPILLGRKEVQGPWRITFSPFFSAYYYFSSLDFFHIFSWIVWVVLIAFLARSRAWLYCALLVVGIGGIFFLVRGGLYLLSAPGSHSNLLVPAGLALVLIGGGILVYPVRKLLSLLQQ